jgi:hypothetical protein
MVEIKVYYDPHIATPGGPVQGSLGGIAIMLVIAVPIIAYEMSKHNFDEEGKASLILDGCGDCGSFWFDKGEIDRISKARKVGDEMGY